MIQARIKIWLVEENSLALKNEYLMSSVLTFFNLTKPKKKKVKEKA